MFALRRLAQITTSIKKAHASYLGTSKLLLAIGGLDDVARTRDLLLLDSKAPTSDFSNVVLKDKDRKSRG